MNGFASAAFFAFGSLLVLFGANASGIIRELELDYDDFGFVASVLSLGIGCGILCAGPLIDRLPRRPLFFAAVGSVVLATIVLGPETGYDALLVSSFTIGFGAGFYETLLNAVIVEESGVLAPRRLLFIHSAATLGATLTPFAIGLLREPLDLHWYDSFRASGFLHAALFLGIPLLPNRGRTLPASSIPSSIGSRSHSGASPPRSLLLLSAICLSTFVYVGVESTLTFFVADHAQNELGFAADRSTGIVGFFWAGLLAGRLSIGLSRRTPDAGMTALLALFASSVLGAYFFAGWSDLPELVTAMAGFFLGGVFPIMIGLAGMTLPGATGTAVGLAAGLGSLGGFFIPWLTGILATYQSLALALSTLSVWLLALVAATAFVQWRQIR